MANQHISPGVYTKIIDLSTYLQAVPGNSAFVPFFSRRGPDNQLVYVTGQQDFSTKFGPPNFNNFGDYSQGKYMAWNHLGVSGSLYAMRVLPDNASYSNLKVSYNTSGLTSEQLDEAFNVKDNVVAASSGDVTLSNTTDVTIDTISVTHGDRVLIKEQTDPTENGIYTFDSTAGFVRAEDADTRSELEDAYVYVQEDESEPIASNSGKSFIVTDLEDGSLGSIDVNVQQWTGGIIAEHVTGLTSELEIENELQADGDKYPMFMIYGIGRGDAYNDIGVTMRVHDEKAEDEVLVMDVYQTQSDGQSDEIIESFEVSLRQDAVDDEGESIYLPEVVNRFSNEIKVMANDDNVNEFNIVSNKWFNSESNPSGEFLNSDITGSGDIVVSYSISLHLYGGTENDYTATDNEDKFVIIDPVTGRRTLNSNNADSLLIDAYTGLKDDSVLDLDNIYFPLVYDGGYSDNVKMQGIYTLVKELRRDCVAICDNGNNYNPSEALASMDAHDANSFLVAFYEPYSKVFDQHTGKNIWVSPVYHMSTMIPQNDRLHEIWAASAGFRRGTISDIKELRYNTKLNNRDRFYKKQINPIVKFDVGYTVWGQLTSLPRPSALQDLNIVRTVLYIKRVLEQYAKWYIFEHNIPETWQDIQEDIDPFLSDLVSRNALETYTLNVGATEYEKKQKRMHINVELKPVKVIERIEINLKVK